MDAQNVHVLFWLIGFSYLIHIVNAMVAIWDRLRAKPSIIDRLQNKVSKEELTAAMGVVGKRIDSLHAAVRQAESVNQGLFRDILRAIGALEGRK